MKNTRKRPIFASKHNRWIDHPVTRFYDGEYHNLSAYFYYNENEDQVAMVIPVYEKKTDTLYYELSVIDPDTGKSRPIEKCSSSKEAMDVFDERKDYFINASTAITGSTDEWLANRIVRNIKSNPVKTSIGGDEDSIIDAIMSMSRDDMEKLLMSAYRKSEYAQAKTSGKQKYQADRIIRDTERKYVPHMSERDLLDTLVNLVIEKAIVPTKKASSIKGGSYTMRKKRFTVKASTTAKRRNGSVMCAKGKTLATAPTEEDLVKLINEYYYSKNYEIRDGRVYNSKTDKFMDDVAVEQKRGRWVFKRVEASTTMKRKRVCTSSSMRKPVKRFIKASIGDDVYADDIKDIIRKSGIKVYDVNKSRTHNSDSFFSILLDDTNDFNAVVDAIEGAGYGVSYDYPAVDGNYMYVIITDNREDDKFLYRVTYGYNSDVVPMDGETSDYQSVLDALMDMKESRGDKDLYTYDEAESEGWYEDEYVSGGNHGLILYTGGNFDIKPIGWGKPSEVKSSKSIKGRKRVSASKRMRKSVKASAMWDDYTMTIIQPSGKRTTITDHVGSFESLPSSQMTWYSDGTRFEVTNSRGETKVFEKVATDDAVGGYADLMEVKSSTSIKCSDPIDSKFMVDLYYSPNHSGRAGDRYFYDWSEVENYAHEALMNGLYVSIWNKENGDTLDISPEEYNDTWENGAADFDINEEIVEFKNRIINSAKSIKCATITYNGNQYDADTVSQYYDMSVTNYGDLGAENEQEFFDKYIELDPDFVKLFDYDITPINSTQDIKCSTVTDMHGNAVNLVTM